MRIPILYHSRGARTTRHFIFVPLIENAQSACHKSADDRGFFESPFTPGEMLQLLRYSSAL